MRIIIFIILTFVFFSCSQQNSNDKNLISPKDTSMVVAPTIIDSLIIIDDNFALDPFSIKVDFNYFIKKIKTNYTIVDAYEHVFSDEGFDTLKVLKWGYSFVKAIPSNGVKEFFLISLVIYDNNFVLDKNIKVGQSAQSVFEKFNAKFDKTKNYKFLQIETKEASYNVIYFNFTKNILTSFEYYPYLG